MHTAEQHLSSRALRLAVVSVYILPILGRIHQVHTLFLGHSASLQGRRQQASWDVDEQHTHSWPGSADRVRACALISDDYMDQASAGKSEQSRAGMRSLLGDLTRRHLHYSDPQPSTLNPKSDHDQCLQGLDMQPQPARKDLTSLAHARTNSAVPMQVQPLPMCHVCWGLGYDTGPVDCCTLRVVLHVRRYAKSLHAGIAPNNVSGWAGAVRSQVASQLSWCCLGLHLACYCCSSGAAAVPA